MAPVSTNTAATTAVASTKRTGTGTKVKQYSANQALATSTTKTFFKLEDETSKNLDQKKIDNDFHALVGNLRTLLTNNSSNWKKAESRDTLLLAATKLRKLNRLSNYRNRASFNKLTDARQKVESHFHSLQNINNEISHLRKNIDVCLEFQPSDANIELAELDEFYANAPEEIVQTEVTKSDPHQLQLARLNFELNERKNMLANLHELEGRKSALLSDIRGKEQRLSQIKPKIGSIKRSTGPLLNLLGVKTRQSTAAAAQTKASSSSRRILQLRPIRVNEDVCREIFGSSFVELGPDAEVKIREQKMEMVEDVTSNNNSNDNAQPLSTSSAKTFFKLEDEAGQNLDQSKVENDFHALVGNIRTLLATNSSETGWTYDGSSRDHLLLTATKLRNLNRLANFRNKLALTKLDDVRQQVETHVTTLRNIVARIAYLRKNVETCTEFNTSDADLELIDLDEFCRMVPAEVRSDPHRLQLARLNYELNERKSMLANLHELEGRKSVLLSDIRGKEQRLTQIKPKIDSVKRIAKPLLDIVGLKSVALAIHNREMPFRPLEIGADTYREIFGEKAVEKRTEGNGDDDDMEDWEKELAMQIDQDYTAIS